MKWTKKEEELLIGYGYASDEEGVGATIEYIYHMLYKEGSHPELKGRTLEAVKKKYYKIFN